MNPYLYMIKIKILLTLSYRAEVFFNLFAKVIILFASVYVWKAAYYNIGIVSDVDEHQMIIYTIMSICISSVFTVYVDNNIRSRIRMGDVAIDYIKPQRIFLMYFSQDLGDAVAAFLQSVIPVLIISSVFITTPLPASLISLLLFIISISFSFIILWFISALFGLLYFWFIDLGPLGFIKDNIILILSGSFVPVWLFPKPLQAVLTFLPFVYTYQHPLSIYIGKISFEKALAGMGIQLIWIVILFFIFISLRKKVDKNIMVQGG